MKRRFALVLMSLAIAFSATGCKNRQTMPTVVSTVEGSAFPLTINGITFESAPEKVVSLSPFITDIIYDIGAEGSLAAVCNYCEGSSASSVGSALSPDIEAIKNSGAQVVLTMTPLDADDANELENAGVSVMELKSPVSLETLENLYASMIGILCGNADFQSTAQSILSSTTDAVESFEKSEKSVLCIVSEHMNTAGSKTLCGDIISLLATNAQTAKGYGSIADEETDADVVFADISLENVDISQYTDNAEVYYVDFSPLENPSAENIYALVTQMCEYL